MKFVITIDCGPAPAGGAREIVIEALHSLHYTVPAAELGATQPLRDAHGNAVGEARWVADEFSESGFS